MLLSVFDVLPGRQHELSGSGRLWRENDAVGRPRTLQRDASRPPSGERARAKLWSFRKLGSAFLCTALSQEVFETGTESSLVECKNEDAEVGNIHAVWRTG